MNFFWLDASALVKRYVGEKGTPLINHLFAQTSPRLLVCLLEGIGETVSILVRRKNQDVLTARAYRQVLSELRSEISENADVEKVYQTRAQVVISWQWIEKHSLNSTDSIILQCTLDKANELRADGHDLILVSADARLIRAANAEGILTFNPETDGQAVLDSLF
ncbi:MAG TPA: type II toxin-antitoxin system VapC family toxin [Blastocatellia bacterium]|nr:type II toxin-antitoxin system VapC family toxin [Blastocatellia bacterium]HMV81881.1 type II toxin-antitoxin system VapC family toxin [Blastocatellia bacterium]HMY72347.1 type II toxin-antitoxin system VapC family toxin [Blastocatellia bacterium]HMZ18251.1 type II toxin-antitoxin system VapC family toxin [Blastocatellia bacterium]HNG33499.1 type II toxin-antitoxin system VapC family toxin [Blastocatellia bacterium]